jgi:hypothetical protein
MYPISAAVTPRPHAKLHAWATKGKRVQLFRGLVELRGNVAGENGSRASKITGQRPAAFAEHCQGKLRQRYPHHEHAAGTAINNTRESNRKYGA